MATKKKKPEHIKDVVKRTMAAARVTYWEAKVSEAKKKAIDPGHSPAQHRSALKALNKCLRELAKARS